jgi:hypothetical protein
MNSDLYNKCSYYLASNDLSIFTDEERSKLRIFVQTDQSGAEALIVAYLCYNGDYRQLFINSIKPHSFLGMHLFKDVWTKEMLDANLIGREDKFDIMELIECPIPKLKSHPFWKPLDKIIKESDNWPDHKRYYYLSKQTEHSSNYGITTNPFRLNVLDKSGGKIMLSYEDADRFLITKHSLFPEIRDWHKRLRAQVDMTRIVYNLHGHPLAITWHDIPPEKWKEVYAISPQSTVGMITNIAFSRLQEYTEENNLRWDHLINCHDSILSQCPVGEEKLLGIKQKEFIGQWFESPVDGVKFQMKSETQVGFNWGVWKRGKDGKPDTNKLGLRELTLI